MAMAPGVGDTLKPGAFTKRAFRSAAVAATNESPVAGPRDAFEAFYALCGVGALCRGPALCHAARSALRCAIAFSCDRCTTYS